MGGQLTLARARASALEAVESANKAKTIFLAVMSHELRTPINAIAGHAQLVEMGVHGPITDAQRQALERIQHNQRHLLGLVNNVLDIARIEAGQVEYTIQDIDLQNAGDGSSLNQMIEPQLVAKQLGYDVQIHEPILVRADQEKLTQILLNLLSNAAKYTPPVGRVVVDTTSSRRRARRHLYSSFRTRGPRLRIPLEKQAAIFEPFVQECTQAWRAQPRALGCDRLSISRDFARGMGGDLRVRSTGGQGSVFTLSLRRGNPP